MPTCRLCQSAFQITKDDLAFYEQMGVPSPTQCPDCRMRQRLCFRNERCLYRRTCDFSGKQIISVYHQESPYRVYDYKIWTSDKWDALEYGRDIDFSRPFFEQFAELEREVPKTSLLIRDCENSDYVNNDENEKNCYMTFASGFCEDCYYGRMLLHSKDCVDCLNLFKCELCYECTNATNCYHCLFSQNINNSNDLFFCNQMIGCSDCIGCSGLRQKKYCVFNEQKTKEEFEEAKQDFLRNIGSRKPVLQEKFNELTTGVPQRFATIVNSEACDGDYINDSKGCSTCFDIVECQDCTNVWDAQKNKNCRDMMIGYQDELVYNTMGVALNSYMCLCSAYCWNCQEIAYCQHCFNSKNLFGCIGLQRNQYCILNKQYSAEQYAKLRQQLIVHMQKTGEWSEFFPVTLSPFAYNETVALDYFPMTKTEVTALDWKWKEESTGTAGKETIAWNDIPEEITDVHDSITEQTLACQSCQRNYRIVPQELAYYRRTGLPLPKQCFNCRHLTRLVLRNPRKLWNRNCAKCKEAIATSFAPEKPETVYCEKCYLNAVY